jgi:hypothetical protein
MLFIFQALVKNRTYFNALFYLIETHKLINHSSFQAFLWGFSIFTARGSKLINHGIMSWVITLGECACLSPCTAGGLSAQYVKHFCLYNQMASRNLLLQKHVWMSEEGQPRKHMLAATLAVGFTGKGDLMKSTNADGLLWIGMLEPGGWSTSGRRPNPFMRTGSWYKAHYGCTLPLDDLLFSKLYFYVFYLFFFLILRTHFTLSTLSVSPRSTYTSACGKVLFGNSGLRWPQTGWGWHPGILVRTGCPGLSACLWNCSMRCHLSILQLRVMCSSNQALSQHVPGEKVLLFLPWLVDLGVRTLGGREAFRQRKAPEDYFTQREHPLAGPKHMCCGGGWWLISKEMQAKRVPSFPLFFPQAPHLHIRFSCSKHNGVLFCCLLQFSSHPPEGFSSTPKVLHGILPPGDMCNAWRHSDCQLEGVAWFWFLLFFFCIRIFLFVGKVFTSFKFWKVHKGL